MRNKTVLTSDSDTNMLTNIASDLLTYTALAYAADYFLDERSAVFDAKSSSFSTWRSRNTQTVLNSLVSTKLCALLTIMRINTNGIKDQLLQ